MLSTDARKAALKTFVDDLEADTRLKKWDREFLTYYKGALDSSTKYSDDMTFSRIMQDFMIIAAKNQS